MEKLEVVKNQDKLRTFQPYSCTKYLLCGLRLPLERSKVFEKANKIEKLDQAVRGAEKVVLGSREQVVLLAEWGEGGGGVGAVHRLPDVGRPPRPRLSTGLPGLSAGCRPAVGRR